jgi:hypothetical protein
VSGNNRDAHSPDARASDHDRWIKRDSAKRSGAPIAASILDEALQLLAAARMPELAERFGLDLTDALARDLEVLADLFE